MKRQILISLISLGSILTMHAQTWSGSTPGNIYYNQGFVGIGTTSPSEKLHLENGKLFLRSTGNTNNSVHQTGLKFSTDNTSAYSEILVRRGGSSVDIGLQFNTYLNDHAIETMTLMQNKIGIGTTSPSEKLHLENGKLFLRSTGNTNNSVHQTGLKFSTDNTSAYSEILVRRGGSSVDIGLQFNTYLNDHVIETMTLVQDRIGIGTSSPVYKLDVCGTIRAKEVKVDLQGSCGADFVFKSDYKLMDLNELEKFVKINQHLPEIAPEKDMVENGVNMKEMQMKLLQKIEELTLYTIEQNKKIEQQNDKITELEKQNKTIEELKQAMKLQTEEIEKLKVSSK